MQAPCPAFPSTLDYYSWVVVMWNSEGQPLFVKDTINKILVNVPTEAARFREWSLVEEELKYWHKSDRPGYQPFHRYATFALLDPVTGEVIGSDVSNATSNYQ